MRYHPGKENKVQALVRPNLGSVSVCWCSPMALSIGLLVSVRPTLGDWSLGAPDVNGSKSLAWCPIETPQRLFSGPPAIGFKI
jgi:hypothetical protein